MRQTKMRKTKFYKNLNNYLAVAFAEGFCEGEGASEVEQITAFQYIYDNKMLAGLQGRFSGIVNTLLDNKMISR